MLYVQHLLGIGHLKRAATLANAMTSAGLDVTLVSGGLVVPGIALHAKHVVQLPPASAADLSFKTLVDDQGRPVDDAWRRKRCDLLLDVWRQTDPHALLIELFPFGRRQMRFELLPLLDAARGGVHRPVIVSSVRDVLGGGQKDPARQNKMLELFEAHFDHLLVHGDPSLIPFDQTFPQAARIAGKLHYTGYVVDGGSLAKSAADVGRDEVIVSVGGGAVGRALLEAAILARPLSTLAGHHWRLLVGSNITDAELADITVFAQRAGGENGSFNGLSNGPSNGLLNGITIERNRIDFPALLANCRLSISQGGYNTVMDILRTGARAVVVPFAGGSEVEQSVRARLLAQRGWIEVLEEMQLTPLALSDAIDRAAQSVPSQTGTVNLDGAQNSAALVAKWTSELSW